MTTLYLPPEMAALTSPDVGDPSDLAPTFAGLPSGRRIWPDIPPAVSRSTRSTETVCPFDAIVPVAETGDGLSTFDALSVKAPPYMPVKVYLPDCGSLFTAMLTGASGSPPGLSQPSLSGYMGTRVTSAPVGAPLGTPPDPAS